MKYDDAQWHYGGKYPSALPRENVETHIGMFLARAITRGLDGELLRNDFATALAAVRARRMSGRDFLIQVCDEKLTDDDIPYRSPSTELLTSATEDARAAAQVDAGETGTAAGTRFTRATIGEERDRLVVRLAASTLEVAFDGASNGL